MGKNNLQRRGIIIRIDHPLPNIGGVNTVGPEEIAQQQRENRLEMPRSTLGLHPMVRKFGTALRAAEPNYWKFHEVSSFGEGISVSEPRINRALRALHAVVVRLESRGVEFRPSTWAMRSARPTFRKGRNTVVLGIEELREPVKSPVSLPYNQTERPAGQLKLNVVLGYRDRAAYVEKPGTKLEELLHMVTERIWKYFGECEESDRKAREAHARWLEAEKIREEEKRKRDHNEALARIVATRAKNIRHAAQLWRLHRDATEFIDECERRWTSQAGALSQEQVAWLSWARVEVKDLSPFQAGYPDPTSDGAFEPSSVPLGGPYPTATALPETK